MENYNQDLQLIDELGSVSTFLQMTDKDQLLYSYLINMEVKRCSPETLAKIEASKKEIEARYEN
tara:strand:+ start:747 stop:938 length:192 start_codon:yes stop_codon:yes gene_type:complete